MTQEQINLFSSNPDLLVRYVASQRLLNFVRYINPKYEVTNFHKVYTEVLDRFAHQQIKKLIISCPPQHGKSEISSRMLPSFLMGLNPDLKIVIASYNAEQAKSFNRDVQRIINSEAYQAVFPNTFLNTKGAKMDNVYKCNADTSEPVGHRGFVRGVGRGGALTGKSVDVLILDDVYKDYAEANSPLVRNLAWKWWVTVCRTRLHNDSQEIIVFTRWHEDDIIGKLEKSGEKVRVLRTWEDMEDVPQDTWLQLNFPALHIGEPTELDPRQEGEPLWAEKHSKEKLLAARQLDPVQFEALYQGDPGSAESRLYGEFKTYVAKSDYGTYIRSGCVIDVASGGNDFLASICYDIYRSPNTMYNEKTHKYDPILYALVTDIIYTQEGTDVTYVSVPEQINRNGAQKVFCESNSAGKIFAETISKKVRAQVEQFFTSANKESKLLTNASLVTNSVIFPVGWETRWEKAHYHITHFLRNIKAASNDDLEDALSELVLREIAPCNLKPYRSMRRGIRRGN